MKKVLSLIAFFSICTFANAQYVNIPDSNFRNFLISKYPGCFNTANQLDTNCTAITTADTLYCSHLNIRSIDGIQYFDNLVLLDCQYNAITALPKLPSTLKSFDCSYNKVALINNLPVSLKRLCCASQDTIRTSIPSLPNNLVVFMCNSTYTGILPNLPNTLDSLLINNCQLSAISSLPTNLKYLDCSLNGLNQLPSFPSSLRTIVCGYNYGVSSIPPLPAQLITLDIQGLHNVSSSSITLPSTLQSFICSYCSWSSLPALPSSLTSLYMDNNNFPNLPINLPNSINYLTASNCQITNIQKLPTSLGTGVLSYNSLISLPNLPTSLSYLNIAGNEIKTLPTLPTTLMTLIWNDNKLDSIKPITVSGLTTLYLSDNNLKALPTLPTNLRYLYIDGNQFDTFPGINSNLFTLDISFNYNLTELKTLPKTLRTLNCAYDTSLTCLSILPKTLTRLTLESTKIQCVPNKPALLKFYNLYGYLLPAETYPICNPTNNSNHCVSFPTLVGAAFHDMNKNRIWDIGETPKAFGLVMLSNGNFTFTDTNGVYSIQLDTLGTFNVRLLGSSFYTNVPTIKYATANRYDTIIYLSNFALQPNATVDSVQIFATPLCDKARPGFPFLYFVGYANVGTTSLSPTITFNYPGNYLNYDSCSNHNVTNANSQLTTTQSMAAGKTDLYLGYFKVKPAATLGDTLKPNASITSTQTNAVFDAPYTVISGAFDPNDKAATPYLTPAQVAAAKPVDYVVRFQNTGTDTAFNIVIADSLSGLLQKNTLQVVSSSHKVKTTVKNGVAYFEFLNIKLPDSNVNKIKSNGFVRFTIKPLTTLTLGTNIYNKAYIYFDYNAPIITNTAVTTVKNPGLPLRFINYKVSLQNNAAASVAVNEWTTGNEINVSHFNIQRSYDGRTFEAIGKVKANNFITNKYEFRDEKPAVNSSIIYYKIESVDIDGKIQYNDVKMLNLKVQSSGIIIYPNPAKDIINISSKENIREVKLLNTLGKIIYRYNNINNTSHIVQLALYTKGLYLLQITKTSGEVYNDKLIVE